MSAFTFTKENGSVQNREWLWDSLKRFFQTLPDGQYIWPHPAKPKKNRSGQQNRYYWGVVCKLVSDHTGYTPEESHQIMAEMFLSYEKEGKVFTRSTTKLRTADFEIYMEQCRRWAAMELRIYLPLPNEPGNYFYEMSDTPNRKKENTTNER